MARTKKTVRFDGRVAGIKITVTSDRHGVAARAKRKIIDAAWKRVDEAAQAAAGASTEYGRALIDTDPRRVDTGYMRDTFSVDASKGGKVVEIGWHKWAREKPYYSWQENGTQGAARVATCVLAFAARPVRLLLRVLLLRSTCRV